MAEKLFRLKRTDMCGEITEAQTGSAIVVNGWVQDSRNLGGLIFVRLRDRSGFIQIVFDETVNKELFNIAQSFRSEDVVAVKGVLRMRTEGNFNPDMKTGKVEIVADDVQVLSKSETPPFEIIDDKEVSDAIKLKYRYLDLRKPSVQKNFIIRHKAAQIARNYFSDNGFLEIETPMLTKSTPEGARDYLVPSRVHGGKFYALPQSPQLYKQILMVSGMDKYFQIARCFRDEDLRADRQPEFTQIDLEMSFVQEDDVMTINEGFLRKAFKEILGYDVPEKFDRIPYCEAMERWGSDKPDRRFKMELCDLSDIVKDCEFKVFTDAVENGGSVRAINVEDGAGKLSRKEIDKLVEFVKTYKAKGMAWITVEDGAIKSSIAKFLTQEQIDAILEKTQAKPGDIVMIVADKNKVVFDSLGALRCHLAKKLDLIDENEYNFLWVTEFPLFEYDEEEERYVAVHHPFTSPMDEDIHLLETEPGKVRAKAYDIVLNGYELGGGSIRIHNSDLQSRMFKALGFTEERAWNQFGFLLEAFKYGTPPHGGMAYGLDRLVMLLCKKDSIRDVIAFPKVQNASELMTNAPSEVDAKQLKELSIDICIEETKEE